MADVARLLLRAATEGVNCWFAVGSAMTRQNEPYMVHCFSGEMFAFQLNDQQAAALQLDAKGLRTHRDQISEPNMPVASPAVSLEELELRTPKLTQTQPFVGRVHYNVPGDYIMPWCVRLDHELPGGRRACWAYRQHVLWGTARST